MIIDFTINNTRIKRTDSNYLVNLSKGYLQCRFNFLTDDWEGLEKYALFNVKGENYRHRIYNGEVFNLPDEIHNHKYFYVQAYGMDDEQDKHLTTNKIIISLDNEIIQPLYIKDDKIEDMVNMVGGIINEKVDSFKVDSNKLICYFDGTPIQIIPINNNILMDFLTENYIDIDARKLDSKGLLFYERYKLI